MALTEWRTRDEDYFYLTRGELIEKIENSLELIRTYSDAQRAYKELFGQGIIAIHHAHITHRGKSLLRRHIAGYLDNNIIIGIHEHKHPFSRPAYQLSVSQSKPNRSNGEIARLVQVQARQVDNEQVIFERYSMSRTFENGAQERMIDSSFATYLYQPLDPHEFEDFFR